ncbi:unnamed protein product, partial [Prorocentrum cordatum]
MVRDPRAAGVGASFAGASVPEISVAQESEVRAVLGEAPMGQPSPESDEQPLPSPAFASSLLQQALADVGARGAPCAAPAGAVGEILQNAYFVLLVSFTYVVAYVNTDGLLLCRLWGIIVLMSVDDIGFQGCIVHHKVIDFNRDARQAGTGEAENLAIQKLMTQSKLQTGDNDDLILPQIFIDGVFIGDATDLQGLEDDGVLNGLLYRTACMKCHDRRRKPSANQCENCWYKFEEILPGKMTIEQALEEIRQLSEDYDDDDDYDDQDATPAAASQLPVAAAATSSRAAGYPAAAAPPAAAR